MIFMPPGSAKSTYGSMIFPPWWMARHPEGNVIAASHTAELAERWGRRCRNLIETHGNVLGIALSQDDKAAGRWSIQSGGEYFAAGVGGSITGRRADLVVIDDPVRSREDADSETVREKTDDWFRSDLYTRLKPGAAVIIIQTRWHEDDLSGRLLDRMGKGGDQWRVLSLPAFAGDADPLGRAVGEPLWPEWEDADKLARKRSNMTPREWSALYQQNPVPDEGDYFKRDWLHEISIMPAASTLRVYGASDYAVTSEGGDYTVHVVVGVDAQQRLYLLDVWRGQTDSAAWIEAWCDLVKQHKPIEWAEEQGQIRSGVGPFLQRRAVERQAFTYRRPFPSKTDKAIRAQSIRGRMAMQGLYLPAAAPWKADFVAELLTFPAGKYDDQVDAIGLVGQLLDHVFGFENVEPEKPKDEVWYIGKNGSIVGHIDIRAIAERKERQKRRDAD
jgi:predicted phage terminase large subunit-like protein